jgi:hypothetical protein
MFLVMFFFFQGIENLIKERVGILAREHYIYNISDFDFDDEKKYLLKMEHPGELNNTKIPNWLNKNKDRFFLIDNKYVDQFFSFFIPIHSLYLISISSLFTICFFNRLPHHIFSTI